MPDETREEWEFVTLDGHVIATYDGDPAKLVEAADETARILGIALAVQKSPSRPTGERE